MENKKDTLNLILEDLKLLSKEKLIQIIKHGATISQEYFDYLKNITHDSANKSNEVDDLGEINKILSDSDMVNYENLTYDEKNYQFYSNQCSKIISSATSLVELERFDDLVSISLPIFIYFNHLINYEFNYTRMDQTYNPMEEGDFDFKIESEIFENFEIFSESLLNSSLDDEEKILYAIKYDIILDLESYFDIFFKKRFSNEVWNKVAIKLINILNGDEKFIIDFERAHLIDYTIKVLKRINRISDIAELCENEIKDSDFDNYTTLIEILLKNNESGIAEKHVLNTMSHIKKNTSFYFTLREFLISIKKNKNDWNSVLVLTLEKIVENSRSLFLYYPECKAIADKISLWPKVRSLIITYLHKGIVPWKQIEWPIELSSSDIKLTKNYDKDAHFPNIEALLHIAINESDYPNIIQLYEEYKNNKYEIENNLNARKIVAEDVVRAIHKKYPDKAIEILEEFLDIYIEKIKVYSAAVTYLRYIKEIMFANNKKEEWAIYIDEIKNKHKRKKSFLKLLTSL